jgi:O-antigen/teichoic acid export membrane protein
MEVANSIGKDRDLSLNKAKSLFFNAAKVFSGNVIYIATQWGLLVVLTKFFTPDEFGKYALALAIVTPIFSVSALQLRTVLVTSTTDGITFENYLLLRITTGLLGLCVVVILYMFGVFSFELLPLVLLLGANQGMLNIKDIYQGVMQKHERMNYFSFSRVLQGGATLIAAAAIALLTRDLLLVVVGMFVARFIALLIFDIPSAHRAIHVAHLPQSKLFDWKKLDLVNSYTLAKTALPLGVVSIFISIYPNIPRYFLAEYGASTLGYFAAVASLMALIDVPVAALGETSSRRLAVYFSDSIGDYIKLLLMLMCAGVALGATGLIFALLFGELFLSAFFRPEYAAFAHVFAWLMALRVVSNAESFLGYGLTAARQYRVQIWIQGLGLLCLCLAAWWLIPAWGGVGAAWAMLIASSCTLLATSIVMMKILHTRKSDTYA